MGRAFCFEGEIPTAAYEPDAIPPMYISRQTLPPVGSRVVIGVRLVDSGKTLGYAEVETVRQKWGLSVEDDETAVVQIAAHGDIREMWYELGGVVISVVPAPVPLAKVWADDTATLNWKSTGNRVVRFVE